jgi:hypothetical protein
MVRGLRVVFSPNPVSRMLYSYPVPEPGTRGTVTPPAAPANCGPTSAAPANSSTWNGTSTAWSAVSPCGT